MNQTISIKAPRHAVIGQAVKECLAKWSTSFFAWSRKNLTAKNIIRFIFSDAAIATVAIAAAIVMWWFNITIDDDAIASRKVAIAGMCLMPWACVWAFRETFCEKGGEK